MHPIISKITETSRPKILIKAAQVGQAGYRRERDLRRVLDTQPVPASINALEQLWEEEERVEQNRMARDGTYNAQKHVDILIAVLGEIRNLTQNTLTAI